MTTAEKNRVIKKALSKAGYAKVSVTGSRGTAYGWINIEVTVKEPKSREELWDEHDKIRDIARKALAEVGERFYTYTSDDGYNTERECVHVRAENPEEVVVA